MENRITDIVSKTDMLSDYHHIVLGLSGGPDSVCLFDALMRAGFQIWPVHVNHMLRHGAADRDQAYVEALCEAQSLPLKVVKVDCAAMAREQGLTSEEAGRSIRYEAFREKAREVQSAIRAGEVAPGKIAIALAHHADDQAETILQRIIRGTGTDGLVGMEPVRTDESGFDIIRPLLGVRRADIEAYCEQRELNPCIDHTNSEPVYARNRIRLELIPMLERYNPRVVEAIDRLGDIAAEDKAFLDAQAEAALKNYQIWSVASSQRAFHIDLLQEPLAISRRALAHALAEIGLAEDVTAAHYKAMLALARSDKASAQVDLPHGYKARKEYDRIVLNPPESSTEALQLGDATGVTGGLAGVQVQVMDAAEYQALCVEWKPDTFACFDRGKLAARFGEAPEERILWRTRREGDVLLLRDGRKKLQDLFVDDKVPRFRRDKVRMAVIDSEVLWIPLQEGLIRRARYTAAYSVGAETTELVVIWKV